MVVLSTTAESATIASAATVWKILVLKTCGRMCPAAGRDIQSELGQKCLRGD